MASFPLWESFSFAKDLVKAGFDAEKSQYLFTLAAVAIAGAAGFGATQRQPGPS